MSITALEHLQWNLGGKMWKRRKKGELHHSLNQMAHSSQNPLILPTTLMIFSLARLANLGMTCQQQKLTLHILVYLTKLWKTGIVILNSDKVSVEEMKKWLLSIKYDKPLCSDNLDGKLLKIIADNIATSICHIFNVSLLESMWPQAWREEKVIPQPKISKAPFTGSNNQPRSLLPTLSKLLEKIVFDQIQCYFTINKLTADFQNAYRDGHSTCTLLTQITDDWLIK